MNNLNSEQKIEILNSRLKDVSFEMNEKIRGDPKDDVLNFEISTRVDEFNSLDPKSKVYRLSLKGYLTLKNNDDIKFLVEVEYSTVVKFDNISEENIDIFMNIDAAKISEPYVYQNINNLILNSGFQPVNMLPQNYEDMYQKRLSERI